MRMLRKVHADRVPPARSAGLLLWRPGGAGTGRQVLIAHMGGPLWAKKDERAWSIPKGEYGPDENARVAAAREFAEELGSPPPDGSWRELGEVTQRNGKIVTAWALEGDFDTSTFVSNTFDMEWPPRSGRRQTFPEMDRAEWVDIDIARRKLVAAQTTFLDRLLEL